MTDDDKRERLRLQEKKNNPLASLNDGLNENRMSGMSFKGTGITLIVLVIAYIIYKLMF